MTNVLTLSHPTAQHEFFKYLVKHRCDFVKGQNHDAAFARMILQFKKMSIVTSLHELRKKRLSAQTKFRNLKIRNIIDGWKYCRGMAVHNGIEHVSVLNGTDLSDFVDDAPAGIKPTMQSDDIDSFFIDITKFTKGMCTTFSFKAK